MLMVKRRWAPAGGGGKGAARETMLSAARSRRADPEDRATASAASPPEGATVKPTTVVPRPAPPGRPARAMRWKTSPG